MAAARDLVGIGVPFAAGAAAGAALRPLLPSFESLLLTASILALLAGAAAIAALCLDHKLPSWRIRSTVALMFLATGLFCSVQPALTSGLPSSDGGPVRSAARKAVLRTKACIDSVHYPSATTKALVKALLTGDRSGLDRETTEVFRSSGASHILALSGLHLGMIYLILCKLLLPLGNSRRAVVARSVLTTGLCGFYTVMTGASPSIVRAFLFIALAETIRLAGRRREAPRVLLASLTIQLAVSPESIGSLGFQLSYLAMGGIIFIYPWLKGLYPESGIRSWDRIDPMKKVWRGAAMSISCQIPTAPLVWLRFGTFPEYFLITNLIALPMTSAMIVLSVATIALSALGLCPGLLVKLNDTAVQALVWCLRVISGL